MDHRIAEGCKLILAAARGCGEVTRSLGQFVKALDPVRGQLRRHRLDILQVVDRLVSVGLRSGSQILNLARIDPSKFQRVLEFIRCIRRLNSLRDIGSECCADAADGCSCRAEADLPDRLKRAADTASEGLAESRAPRRGGSSDVDAAQLFGDFALHSVE